MKIRAIVEPSNQKLPWVQWRIGRPYVHLRRLGIDAGMSWDSTEKEKNLDIIVIPRILTTDKNLVIEWAKSWRDRGAKIVYELDDDLFSESYVEHISKAFWLPNTGPLGMTHLLKIYSERAEVAKWMLQQVDAVTTSTHALTNYVKLLCNVPVYTVKNAIDISEYEKALALPKPPYSNDKVTIGWFGGLRAPTEVEEMIEAWTIIAKSRDDVLFVCIDWLYERLKNVSVFQRKLIRVGWEDKYPNHVSNMRVDIGCCAVDNEPFSDRKSTIKVWEYALADALPISIGNMYKQEVGTLWVANTSDMVEYLHYYIEHEEERKNLAKVYKDHVYAFHNLKYNAHDWFEAYKDVCNKVLV